jgi:predicted ester cyclase
VFVTVAASETKEGAKPKTTAQIGRAYFNAIGAKNLDEAVALWKPGSPDHIHGIVDMTAPAGIKEYFTGLFEAFPDFSFEILEFAASGKLAACRWRIRGTFLGPGRFQGLVPNGRPIAMEGCDMLRVEDGQILENNAYTNAQQIAEQLGVLPPIESAAGKAMTGAINAKTSLAGAVRRMRSR